MNKYQESLNTIKRCCEDRDGCYCSSIERLQELIDHREVLEKHFHKWIPVKEIMPVFAGYAVLATLENVYGQRRVEKIFTGYGYGKQWHCNNKCIDMEKWNVIAWQELPETYIGDKKDAEKISKAL